MKIINGREIAKKIRQKLKKEIKKLKTRPGLAVILVGKEPASQLYVSLKKKAAKEVGIRFYQYTFNQATSQEKILEIIKKLNQDEKIQGIIVQLPLPEKFDTAKIIRAIEPKKDVDGFHPQNLTLLKKGEPRIWPVFPKAILKMIEATGQRLTGRKVIALVNSKIFGQVLVFLLRKKRLRANYIIVGHRSKSVWMTSKRMSSGLYSDTLSGVIQSDIVQSGVVQSGVVQSGVVQSGVSLDDTRKGVIQKADILISACGCPGLIDGSMIKKGAIVIDGGIKKVDRKVFGDVDVKSVADKASFISPVPGGVGPVTVALLLNNTYLLAKKYGRK